MKVRDRIAHKDEYDSQRFTIRDPEFGEVVATVKDFFDAEGKLREESKVLDFEIMRIEL